MTGVSSWISDFGRRVRVRREEMGLTQVELVRLCQEHGGANVSERTIRAVEGGETKSLPLALTIAEVLGLTIAIPESDSPAE